MRVLFLSDRDAIDLHHVLARAAVDYRELARAYPERDRALYVADMGEAADRIADLVNIQLDQYLPTGTTTGTIFSTYPSERGNFLDRLGAMYREFFEIKEEA